MRNIYLKMNSGDTIVINKIGSFDNVTNEEPLLYGIQHYIAKCIELKDYMHQITDLNSNEDYVINVFNIASISVK